MFPRGLINALPVWLLTPFIAASCIDAAQTLNGVEVKTGVLSRTSEKDVPWEDNRIADSIEAELTDTQSEVWDSVDVSDADDSVDAADLADSDFTDADICPPQCEGKECGPDGCGGSCGYCPTLFSCVEGSCQAPDCEVAEPVFAESFDSCGQGAFEIVDFTPDDNVTWWGVPGDVPSEPCSLYMGDVATQNYDTGAQVHLALISPEISIPQGPMVELQFMLQLDLEPAPAPVYPYDYDVLVLYADYIDGGDIPVSEELFHSKMLLNDTENSYEPVRINLLALAGKTVRFRLEFDTVDSIDNGYRGIHLDDFAVTAVCPLCLESKQCADEDLCTREECVLYVNGDDLGSCYVDEISDCCLDQPEEFCDDGDPCTTDTCEEESGQCEHELINTPDCW